MIGDGFDWNDPNSVRCCICGNRYKATLAQIMISKDPYVCSNWKKMLDEDEKSRATKVYKEQKRKENQPEIDQIKVEIIDSMNMVSFYSANGVSITEELNRVQKLRAQLLKLQGDVG